MIRFFALHRTAANALMAVLMGLGLIALPELQRATFPRIAPDTVQVEVRYPGASAASVVGQICRPLEQATAAVIALAETRCAARSSLAVATLELVEGGDFLAFEQDIRSIVDGIDSFPPRAEAPVVSALGRTEPVVSVAIHGPGALAERQQLAEELRAWLLADPLIARARLAGLALGQWQVRIDPARIVQHGLSVADIADRVRAAGVALPGGRAGGAAGEREWRVDERALSLAELAALTVLDTADGTQLRLGDIATIERAVDGPSPRLTVNGQPALLLRIEKSPQQDSLRTLAAVRQRLANFAPRLPAGTETLLTNNVTDIVSDRLEMLLRNGWQGLLLVAITLALCFGFRYAFWVAAGLPVSFLAGLFVMWQLGVTINMLSMVALLLAIGILMDDAIVIAESIQARYRAGLSADEAVVQGVSRVAAGVVSSFLTTACLFAVLLRISGELGQLMQVVPLVLLTVVSVSLIEAFLILPNHLHHSLRAAGADPGRIPVAIGRGLDRLGAWVERSVAACLRARYFSAGAVLALFLSCVGLLAGGVLPFAAFPDIDGDRVVARLRLDAGSGTAQTRAAAAAVEAALWRAAERFEGDEDGPLIEHISLHIGENTDAFESGGHLATLGADLRTAERRRTALADLLQAWREEMPPLPMVRDLIVAEPEPGPAGRPLEFHLSGLPREQLVALAGELRDWIAGYPAVDSVFVDAWPGPPERRARPRAQARVAGLSSAALGEQLRAALEGVEIDEVAVGAERLPVVVQLETAQLGDVAALPVVLPGRSPGSHPIAPLSALATIDAERRPSRYNRIDGQPVVRVLGSVDTRSGNVDRIVRHIAAERLTTLQAEYPALRVRIAGESESAATTQNSIRGSLLAGLAGVYLVLLVQFRHYRLPLAVMVTIPLALIGVVIGHLGLGLDFSMPSLLGFVSLAGIVVNNAILLVSFIQRRLADGEALIDACARASGERLRAILLTSLTTVLGMAPLLFETSLQAQILKPLVASISFGMMASGALVLVFVPCLFVIGEDLSRRQGRAARGGAPERLRG